MAWVAEVVSFCLGEVQKNHAAAEAGENFAQPGSRGERHTGLWIVDFGDRAIKVIVKGLDGCWIPGDAWVLLNWISVCVCLVLGARWVSKCEQAELDSSMQAFFVPFAGTGSLRLLEECRFIAASAMHPCRQAIHVLCDWFVRTLFRLFTLPKRGLGEW